MHSGPHYYVISLGRRTSTLFEAFRDTLIDIQNGGFPVVTAASTSDLHPAGSEDGRLREAVAAVDACFAGYQRQDPLKLVVVGESEMLSMFSSMTAYSKDVVGRVVGDYSSTSLHDLGKIVWPVVREAMSGAHDNVMQELEQARIQRRLVSGIDAVSRWVGSFAGATLLVEGDYHVRGSVQDRGSALTVSDEVDVTEVLDDVIDVLIEKILDMGGHVVFVPNDSLESLQRIVLLLARGNELPRQA